MRPTCAPKCGEPIYEYRLGGNVYNEAIGKIEHVPGMIGASCTIVANLESSCRFPSSPFGTRNIPRCWQVFPVQLVYIGVRPRNDETRKPIVVKARYSFDPGSFFEDASEKEMRYVPNLPSDYPC